MVGWIVALLGGLWGFSRRSWVDVGQGLRPGSRASALYLFLFLLCFLIGGVLVVLGLDLDRVDAWLDGRQTWFDRAGTIAFKALLAFILLISVLVGASGLRGRLGALVGLCRPGRRTPSRRAQDSSDAFGWVAILLAFIAGYFAAVGLFI